MSSNKKNNPTEIAIIGMSAKFPEAPSLKAFWDLLIQGKNATRFFTKDELMDAGYDEDEITDPDFLPTLGSILEDKDKFDAHFFGLTPNEALFLEPQIRVFLQAAWHALEDAGAAGDTKMKAQRTGVFAGASNAFLWQARTVLSGKSQDIGAFSSQVLVNKDFIAGQASYLLNLTGPSMSVNTACSTSLAAIHMACQSLINGECDQALAGGSSLHYERCGGFKATAGTVMSSDGYLRAFDESADGMIAGEGVGLVVLKKVEDAIRDNDRIYGIIKGSAINNDGKRKAGFTAPGIQGQCEVIKSAQKKAGIAPEQIQYIETHGSGTPLGDLVEVEALTEAFESKLRGYCGIGSVKTNIGHTDAAAGIAGFIKTVLSVHHRVIPPSLNFNIPNPQIDWVNTPFYVPVEPVKLAKNDPCFMGISSFGIGGTNAHIIVGPYLEAKLTKAEEEVNKVNEYQLVLSAKTSKTLQTLKKELAEYLDESDSTNLRSLQYTLQTGRKSFEYRWAASAKTKEEAIELLNVVPEEKVGPVTKNSVLYMVLDELQEEGSLAKNEAYQHIFSEVESILLQTLEEDFDYLETNETEKLKTTLTPVLRSYTTFKILTQQGVEPAYCKPTSRMLPLSAALAGILSLKEVLKIMIGLETERLWPELYDNSFLEEELSLYEFKNPEFTIISPLNNESLQKTDFETDELWRAIINEETLPEEPIQFNDQVTALAIIGEKPEAFTSQISSTVTTITITSGSVETFEKALAEFWVHGVPVSWDSYFKHEDVSLESIPGYPFDENSFWIEDREIDIYAKPKYDDHEKLDYSEWFHIPNWERSSLSKKSAKGGVKSVVAFLINDSSGNLVTNVLRKRNLQSLTIVHPGETFKELGNGSYEVNPESREDFEKLFASLLKRGKFPEVLIHGWSIAHTLFNEETTNSSQKLGFSSLIALSKALASIDTAFHTFLKVLTLRTQQVLGTETINPTHATLAAAIKSVSQEIPHVKSLNYDLEKQPHEHSEEVLETIVSDILKDTEELAIAYRSGFRWKQSYHMVTPRTEKERQVPLTKEGTYIVVGGLGRIGYTIAEHISEAYRANIVIIGRSKLPKRTLWDKADRNRHSERVTYKVGQLQNLERNGSNVMYSAIEIDQEQQWTTLFEEVKEKFGSITGIFHAAGETRHEIISRSVEEIDNASVDAQFQPKMNALTALHLALKKQPVEFCIVTSSIASILGGLGFTAYTAANGFIDSFVNYANKQGSTRWIAVNTAEWRFELGDEFQQKDKRINTFMTPKEGLATYLSIMDFWKYPQVIISTMDFKSRLKQWVMDISKSVNQFKEPGEFNISRPELEVAYEAPKTKAEEKLAAIWTKILGYSGVGANDNFFELGGDSLKVIIAISNIHKELKRQIPVGVFFSNPTIALLANWLDNEKQDNEEDFAEIHAVEKQPFYPVSPAQKRLFVIHKIAPLNLGYNETHIFKVDGSFDIERLKKALAKLIHRHESLRTRFQVIDGEPVQVIEEQVAIAVEELINNDVTEGISEFVRPFDLKQAPLMRAGVLTQSEDELILALDFHHIIIDGVSINVLFSDLMNLYNNVELEPLQIQYKDFTMWQLGLNGNNEYLRQQEYWLNQFSTPWEVIDLPIDFKRPKSQSFEGGTHRFTLDPHLSFKIKQLASDLGVTDFMVLVAAFQCWLTRLTGQSEVIIGTPALGRRHEALEEIVGMFVNTLALRIKKEDTDTFTELINKVKDISLGAVDHQEYPFETLVEQVVTNRDLSRHPLFDVVFIYQKTSNAKGVDHDQNDEFEIDSYRHEQSATKFDLAMDVVDVGTQFVITFQYSTALFKQETIARWGESVKHFYKALVANPTKNLTTVSMLDKESYGKILSWNTHKKSENLELFPAFFSNKAALSPDKQVVHYEGNSYTYADLDARSNVLAWALTEKGFKSGETAAIHLNRSVHTLVAILGVWKAGGTYVPIAPTFPKSRIEYILNESEANLLISDNDLMEGSSGIERLRVDLLPFETEGMPSKTPPSSKNEIACILYTSGSTGVPKGVQITHKALMNNLQAINNRIPFEENDVILFKSAFVFDVSLYELFSWCLGDSHLAILPEGDEKEPSKLTKAIDQYGVTHVNFVNTMLDFYTDYLEKTGILNKSLKHIVQGGEVLTASSVEKCKNVLPDIRLFNLYGPAEATIGTTIHEVKDVLPNESISIGTPIHNVIIDIVDGASNSQPIGIYGEIAISGFGLSKGYKNNETLTREKFVERNGRVFYLTGDHGRWLPNGTIEFAGRKDHQVKLFGNRIELHEIEKTIQAYPSIERALVVFDSDKTGTNLLIAYIKTNSLVEADGLREYLASKLPSYMIPGRFMEVTEFPLTETGKIDRNRLNEHSVNLVIRELNQEEAPTGEKECLLAYIWQDVLGVEVVSRLDSFFDLGGDSIRALRVVAKLFEEGFELEVKDIFEKESIANIAGCLKTATYVPEANNVEGEIKLTPIQNWFFDNFGDDKNVFTTEVLLKSNEYIEKSVLENVWVHLINHHHQLRASFIEKSGKIIQYIQPGISSVEIAEFDLTKEENPLSKIEAHGKELKTSMHIDKGPLVKLGLFHLPDGDRLMISIHHLVVDTYSWRIIINDMQKLLFQSQSNESLMLPPRSDSYKKWSDTLQTYTTDAHWKKEHDFWKTGLDKNFDKFEINHEQLENTDFEKFIIIVPEEETITMKSQLVKSENIDFDNIILSAISGTLGEWKQFKDVLIAVDNHGRETNWSQNNVSRTVGWFTSIYPVPLETNQEGHDAIDYLKYVTQVHKSIPNYGIGYGSYVYKDQQKDEERLALKELPQIVLGYMGQFDESSSSDAEVEDTVYFELSGEDVGFKQEATIPFLIEFTAFLIENRLQIAIRYRKSCFSSEDIEMLNTTFKNHLLQIASEAKETVTPLQG